MVVDKKKLKDSRGQPLTQSLFLELEYNDFAVFTLKDHDYEYEGKLLPSLKRLFIEMADPVEYDFANEYLLGWTHWKRLNNNKRLATHFEVWREELTLSMRSTEIKNIIDMSAEGKSFQASKWLAEGGWNKRGAGRPSKQEKQRDERMASKLDDQFSADLIRMQDYKGV